MSNVIRLLVNGYTRSSRRTNAPLSRHQILVQDGPTKRSETDQPLMKDDELTSFVSIF